jgi:hypothetical protein
VLTARDKLDRTSQGWIFFAGLPEAVRQQVSVHVRNLYEYVCRFDQLRSGIEGYEGDREDGKGNGALPHTREESQTEILGLVANLNKANPPLKQADKDEEKGAGGETTPRR